MRAELLFAARSYQMHSFSFVRHPGEGRGPDRRLPCANPSGRFAEEQERGPQCRVLELPPCLDHRLTERLGRRVAACVAHEADHEEAGRLVVDIPEAHQHARHARELGLRLKLM